MATPFFFSISIVYAGTGEFNCDRFLFIGGQANSLKHCGNFGKLILNGRAASAYIMRKKEEI
ncbi:hypothetical protein GT94_16640 [Geobacillus stearothermophilus]|nr:hypothetical protein ET31_09530 [Geobacillus stearothermophilus]KFX31938.1 hypothetical protein GT94_16640 [Geobacillus stearothermophilus]KZM52426.1 hypothetical protein A3Q36_01700 [Geobacillus stearothermophilus]